MSEPSIKGTAFDSVLQDVRALLNQGALSRSELESRLRSEDQRFLDQKIAPANWYPIECYVDLLELLCEKQAQGRPEAYLFRRGAIAAERLHASGIYPQLDASGEQLGLRVLPLAISMAASIYNFTRWSVNVDGSGERFTVEVNGARDYPNVARFAAEGFLHWTTQRIMGCRVEVWSERSDGDRVVFHGSLDRSTPADAGDPSRTPLGR